MTSGSGEAERDGASHEDVTQSLEQAAAAFLAVRCVGPELIEEDAMFDVGEPGALVDWFELDRRHRRGHVDPVKPHVVRRDDPDVLDNVGVRGLVPRDRWAFDFRVWKVQTVREILDKQKRGRAGL